MNRATPIQFADLKSQGLVKQIDERFSHKNKILIESYTDTLQKVKINFNPQEYFLKNTSLTQAVLSVASSKMYRELGLQTPPVFTLKGNDAYSAQTLQQSVYDFNDTVITLANCDSKYTKIKNTFFEKFKWQIFYDSNFKQALLEFMTPTCLQELQNIFLIDEIRTDIDRHAKNYFFYKSLTSNKYEGIIVIDLEQMVIYNYCGTSKSDFDSFILYPYQSATPQQTYDELCYLQRANDIRELIQDGVLSSGNIATLKRALSYNFPKQIKASMSGMKTSLKARNAILSPVERLWEYNNQTIGKELGL